MAAYVPQMCINVKTLRGQTIACFVPLQDPTLKHLKEAVCEEEGCAFDSAVIDS